MFQVENLIFEFGPEWNDTVFLFDEHEDYKEIGKLAQRKGVDFLGILRNELYLIEATDYRRSPLSKSEDLLLETGRKVKDSLACIVAANRTSNNPTHWYPYARLLFDRERVVRVVLWIESDVPLPPERWATKKEKDIYYKRGLHRKGVQREDLRKRLKWLTPYVLVCSLEQRNWSELMLEVRNLARPESV